ncbi:MAG: hypothetical protein IRZ31_07860 [Thermogemmatispora sp.]|uniref:hypothetical protein n=1 Tax=Thermogemmatispora sp. TaxID=1968838 RepID=UPI00262032F8|nr:hypothetical protein [Thermogemmatispora sp.]MBX5456800.1 hypothetical protein [Thermogemmatispora sp.]
MKNLIKQLTRLFLGAGCSLILVSVLSACNLFGGAGSAPTPTPTSKPTAVSSAISVVNLVSYRGDGYVIGYPHGWKVDTSKPGFTTFSDPQGIAYLSVHVQPNPNGVISAQEQVSVGLQLFRSQVTHYQPVSVAPTASVAGEQWNQGAATGDLRVEGQSNPVTVKVVVLAANHPANSPQTQGFTIAYATAQEIFELADQGEFQPMLRSFAFTS